MLVSPIEEFLKQPDVAKIVQTEIYITLQLYAERSSALNTYCPLVEPSQLSIEELLAAKTTAQKAAIAYHWDRDIEERLYVSMESARRESERESNPLQSILDLGGKPAISQDYDLTKVILGTVASLVRSHINLLAYLAWQKLQNDSPILLWFDWTLTDIADPLRDLVNAHTQYRRIKGHKAEAIAISESLLLNFARLSDINIAFGKNPAEQVNRLLSPYYLPDFVLVDDVVEMPNEEGTPIMTRLLNENTIVFLSKEHGFKRVLGGTLENNGEGGVHVHTYTTKDGVAVTQAISKPCVISSSPSFAIKVKV